MKQNLKKQKAKEAGEGDAKDTKKDDPDRELTKEELGKLSMAEQLAYQRKLNDKKAAAKAA